MVKIPPKISTLKKLSLTQTYILKEHFKTSLLRKNWLVLKNVSKIINEDFFNHGGIIYFSGFRS